MLPNLQPPEMIVVLIIAVLVFGKRLPEVGRSLGKGIIEFKKGLRGEGGDDDFDSEPNHRPSSSSSTPAPALSETSVPKFEPPTSAPVVESAPSTYPD